jgi:GntR family transcriptional repressor for pyruvate dehydrogenase complex
VVFVPVSEPLELSLKRDRLHTQIADQIQDLIVARSLQPGDKLPSERELADQLGISRTVVREAIRTLNVRGLVKVKPGCGTYVEAITPEAALASIELLLRLRHTPEQLGNLYEIRRMVETEVAGLAAERATKEDLSALEEALDAMVVARDDPELFTQHDLDFHSALARATHNDLFSTLLSPIANLWLEVILISYHAPGAAQQGIDHHRKILAALQDRNRERARRAMYAHIHESQGQVEAVRSHISESPDSAQEARR